MWRIPLTDGGHLVNNATWGLLTYPFNWERSRHRRAHSSNPRHRRRQEGWWWWWWLVSRSGEGGSCGVGERNKSDSGLVGQNMQLLWHCYWRLRRQLRPVKRDRPDTGNTCRRWKKQRACVPCVPRASPSRQWQPRQRERTWENSGLYKRAPDWTAACGPKAGNRQVSLSFITM